MEESADLKDFTPAKAHLSLRRVYGDSSHHDDRMNLTGEDLDDTIWKIRWKKLAAQSASWYSTPPGMLEIY